jgi:hypothetical protein
MVNIARDSTPASPVAAALLEGSTVAATARAA